ncbi:MULTISPECIES: N-succinylarginine dihydrolase [unclassified Sphingomonas]|uniref:N-succinylarginine dihydrolase n=1 Tax=unclassified Sphingomonas TaxID=196159 RepID=UPI002856D736|nr:MULTISPECIES: N-succinylarginine dihydrolase [unclassified Sphingomonas]MDR6115648.1 succinylarginine dihydrolase [Sphingomonas sp. SORGH_AS_0789]MDR6150680.1 succinylarginine dihydrolase [Sphingomonas sp. SORGH_AS_0742]
MLREINFDGIIGPSHNYAGLSHGNLAATRNAGRTSHPRAAALQGIAKMRANFDLGLVQGILLPHPRPDHGWLGRLATDYDAASPVLKAQSLSASAMWAANAATVSPAPDTRDGRCHLTVANLLTMPHRSHEWPATLAQLKLIFADPAFVVHPPVPAPFGDEGAANHMRLCSGHDHPGVEIFVYGESGGPFPARQHRQACEAVARAHRLSPDRVLFARQSDAAIAAGAFHNDVVAVANERVLFAHEQAFADRESFHANLRTLMPDVEIVEVPAARVSLEDAITSYLFNAQLVTPPEGQPTLILPQEARDNAAVWSWLQEHVAGNGPIRRLEVVNVRESMANGGGPACLRLRVVADPATIDPRFLVDHAALDRIAAVVEAHWPVAIDPTGIADPRLVAQVEGARRALLESLDCLILAAG